MSAGGASGTDVGNIGVVSAAGGVPRTIVRPGFRVVGAPAWSPGGRSIAFVAGLAVRAQSIYRVDPDGLAELRAELDQFWAKALANFKTIVEQSTEEDE